jgi:hypothetical protein
MCNRVLWIVFRAIKRKNLFDTRSHSINAESVLHDRAIDLVKLSFIDCTIALTNSDMKTFTNV